MRVITGSRRHLARQFGVAEAFNSADGNPDLTADLQTRDFDVVVDASGSQAGLQLSTDIVRTGGRLNLFGWIKNRSTVDTNAWHLKGITVINSSPNSKLRDTFPPAIRLIHQGVIDLKPLVTHVTPLSTYPALMQNILQGDPTYIKGVVTL